MLRHGRFLHKVVHSRSLSAATASATGPRLTAAIAAGLPYHAPSRFFSSPGDANENDGFNSNEEEISPYYTGKYT